MEEMDNMESASSFAAPGTVQFLSGNEAIARGAYEAGVVVATAYPGTPSTEILEAIAQYPEVNAEWSINEKVALEVALGAAIGGGRALCSMKHVGLNVASDPFMTAAYTGVNAGLVIVVCDDPGLYSSQNEQDTRFYGRFAQVPVLDPADAQEAHDYTHLAFELSERFDTPVIVRSTTRVSHTRGLVRCRARTAPDARPYRKDQAKYVMLPAYARQRHLEVLQRLEQLIAFAETSDLNVEELGETAVGIVTAGTAYLHAKEVIPEASFFKLGLCYPLPLDRLRAFAARVERLLVIEEGEPFIEEQLRAAGLSVEGKAYFPRTGELTPTIVLEGLIRAGLREMSELDEAIPVEDVVPRPPILCSGCPHRAPLYALKRLRARVTGDIGCYTLGALPPLETLETCICMGASLGTAFGMEKVTGDGRGIVAVIGDSTFFHSGMTGLLDLVYNQSAITVLILDNETVGMTGGQETPGSGVTAKGTTTRRANIAEVCRALGVEHVYEVDAFDFDACFDLLKRELAADHLSVVIARGPCVTARKVALGRSYHVVIDACTGCKLCLRVACPSITFVQPEEARRGVALIDDRTCLGCSVCAAICPEEVIIQ